MRITKEILKEKKACEAGYSWFVERYGDGGVELNVLCVDLLEADHFNWANWMLTKLFTKEQAIQYAIFAAESVLHIFEEKYPNDNRPREAINTAKNYIQNPTEENKEKAKIIATAAAAARAATAAAARAATAAAARAAADAAYAAAYAAVANNSIKNKIIEFGVSLIK